MRLELNCKEPVLHFQTCVWYGHCSFSDTSVDGTLQVVQIFFDTATYDEIERDVKVTFVL